MHIPATAHQPYPVPPLMCTLQRLRTERCTLRRYNRRDPVDSRHNQKVRDISSIHPAQVLTYKFHPHLLPSATTKQKTKKNRYDYLATKTHAVIVPSCGVDSVPADVCVHLASKTLGRAPLGASTSAARLSGVLPPGTIASFISALEDVPPNHLAMARADWSLSPVLGASSPSPRLVYRLPGGGTGRFAVGAIGIMARVNRALVQRTAGLLEVARREARRGRGGSGEARERDLVCYGPAFTYTEFMPTSSVVRAFLFSVGMIVVYTTLIFVAPVRVFAPRAAGPHSSRSLIALFFSFCFTGAVAVQATGDPDGLWASRSVRSSVFSFLFFISVGGGS